MNPLSLGTTSRLLFQRSAVRRLSTTSTLLKLTRDNPDAKLPDAAGKSSAAPNAKARSDAQSTDRQSSASREEHKSGDEHPAKQPDYQQQPTRKTGIGGDAEVEGGREGLDERGGGK
ncbi:hypothetical protein ACN47E_009155 [Coniothyrium glycines]